MIFMHMENCQRYFCCMTCDFLSIDCLSSVGTSITFVALSCCLNWRTLESLTIGCWQHHMPLVWWWGHCQNVLPSTVFFFGSVDFVPKSFHASSWCWPIGCSFFYFFVAIFVSQASWSKPTWPFFAPLPSTWIEADCWAWAPPLTSQAELGKQLSAGILEIFCLIFLSFLACRS